MQNFKQYRLVFFGFIVIGVMLLGMPAVYAQDAASDPEWSEDEYTEEVDIYDDEEEGDIERFGDFYEDLVYTPVNPCKIVDTRNGGGGYIFAGQTRSYKVYGSLFGQGGSTCNSPVGPPSAVHLAVTVVNPDGKGNVKIFPWGASGSTGLQVNYAPIGTNLANAGTTRALYGAGSDIGVRTQYAGAHLTIQVLGYYTRPERTPVDNYVGYASANVLNNANFNVHSPTCPAGYRLSGGGFINTTYTTGLNFISSRPTEGTSYAPLSGYNKATRWFCQGRNQSGGSTTVRCYVVCTGTPGR